ncbi:MAG: hypothetical protein IT328_24050 [Caldilineaceae bacterium]|nr:hypothetical protein [Caldilineaceae bacterium]
MAYNNRKLLDIVNGQGYLLQEAVEHLVRRGDRQQVGAWSMVSREHYWEHANRQQSGYVDLIIDSDEFVGVVECKRYAQETPWIFLCPKSAPPEMGYSSLHWAYRSQHDDIGTGFDKFLHRPGSYVANFCVVDGQAKEKPMLERVAGNLFYSVEALAAQYMSLPNLQGGASVFLPIIITTAQLYVCKYDNKEIDPVSGTLQLDHAQFETVPFIRFHKVFTNTDIDLDSIERFSEIEERQSQTVIVVQAGSLARFLSECKDLRLPRHVHRWPWHKQV